MVVTREHCSTDVGRGEPVKHIAKGIVKVEVGNADVDNGTTMHDANLDDNKKPSRGGAQR
jgi:hypothetical protein